MQFLYALMICGLVSTTINAHYTCPPEEDIYPCTCSDSIDVSIFCLNLTTVEQLKSVVDGTRNTGNIYLYLINCHISDVPNDIFKGTKLVGLEVEDSEITVPGTTLHPNLVGLENTLQHLFFARGHTEKLGPMQAPNLSHLNALHYVTLQQNYILKVGNDWFEKGPCCLIDLQFRDNDIQEIGDKAFATLDSVVHFTINGNKIVSLSRTMFPKPANNIKILTLSENNLESLPDDIFSDMPKLNSISLYDNKLTTISEATWSSVWQQLSHIDIQNNPIVCDSNIKWIYKAGVSFKVLGTCAEPEHLRRVHIDLLRISDLE